MAQDPVCGMTVNEKTGLRLSKDNQTYYFCSQHCLEKFAHEKKMALSAPNHSCCSAESHIPWFQNKILITVGVLAGLILLSYPFPLLEPFRFKLLMYVQLVWWTILLGLFLGGAIEHFVPREYISHLLAGKKKRSILYAVITGFFMSICSHGILALAIQLYKKGASTSAVVAFLLASPWANFPLTLMLIALFGWIKTFYLIAAAVMIAVVTGLIFQVLERLGWVENNSKTSVLKEDFSIADDVNIRWKKYHFSMAQIQLDMKGILSGAISLSNMVLWWIFLGMGLASLTGAYIPEHIFHRFMGPTVTGMMVTLAFAAVLEVCSEGMSPMAFEIYRQTGAFGNSLIFLMAGVATDYTEIGLLWQNIGPRTALWLPMITVPQILFFGWIGNIIFS